MNGESLETHHAGSIDTPWPGHRVLTTAGHFDQVPERAPREETCSDSLKSTLLESRNIDKYPSTLRLQGEGKTCEEVNLDYKGNNRYDLSHDCYFFGCPGPP